MSAPVDAQIREYTLLFEAELSEIDVTEMLAERVGDRQSAPASSTRRRLRTGRRGPLTAAVVFVAVLVIGVAFGLVAVWDPSTEPATTPPEPLPQVTTTADPAPDTSVPAIADPAQPQGRDQITATWTRIEGTTDSLPTGVIHADPAGGFVAYTSDRSKVWRSEDGITWTVVDDDSPLAAHAHVSVYDGWAIAHDVGGRYTVYRDDGNAWTAVELPESSLAPDSVGPILVSDGVTLIPSFFYRRIDWGNLYEGFAWAKWSTDRTIVIYGSSDGPERTELATLRYETVGETLQLTDIASGQVVHEIVGNAYSSADAIMKRGSFYTGAWVSTDNGPFEFHSATPLEGRAAVLPGGGFISYVGFGQDVDEMRAWTSSDGVTWVDQGSLELTSDQFVVRSLSDRLLAETTVIDDDGGDTVQTVTRWQSDDGLAWTRLEAFPRDDYGTLPIETDLGYLLLESERSVWISPDLQTWTHLVKKPSGVMPRGPFFAHYSVAGEVLFYVTGADRENGPITLWMAPLGA